MIDQQGRVAQRQAADEPRRTAFHRACCFQTVALLFTFVALQPARGQFLTGNLGLHDPSSVIKIDDTYYLYYTRTRIGSKTSQDRINWQNGPRVFGFGDIPNWTQEEVPANNGNLWAPDVAFFNNQYHLYYSVSSFGSQDSAIGLVTNPTLNPDDPNYEWTDQGPVILSDPGQVPYNAIDPAIIETSEGELWMSFGSFWNGIYLTELDQTTGKRISPRAPTISIARHTQSPANAIEASYIYERDGMFYLFVNWDSCCQGSSSTYNIRVGRSSEITGPYFDRNGVNMLGNGGTLFLGTEGDFIGPGHISIFTDEGVDWFGYHYYDGNDNGASKYNLRTVLWDEEGWPIAGPAVAELVPGDVDLDGVVTLDDFDIISDHLFETGATRYDGDLTDDGVVDYDDFRLWKGIFESLGNSSNVQVPEPGSVTLAVIYVAVMLSRRRRRRTNAVATAINTIAAGSGTAST